MKFDKIKEILKGKNINFKDKKLQAISGAIAGALIIAVTGTMILHNKNVENKTVAIDNKIEDKSSDKISDDNKEELAVENIDNTTEDKEIEENIDEHVHDENCNHDEENSISQDNNQAVAQNSSDINKQESSTQSSNDKKATTTTQTNTNKNDSTSNSNTNKNTHTHSWVEVYKDVNHAEEGHYENVLVKAAWTESVPVYTEKEVLICNDCGADLTNLSNEDFKSHMKSHMLSGGKGSYRTEYKQVQTGTNTITHDAVYEQKWVVDKPAWNERVLSGYKCSSCGATK